MTPKREPAQLEFDIDDGVPRAGGDVVLCVDRYSAFCGAEGVVTGIWKRNVYVRFGWRCGGAEIRMYRYQLQRLTQTGGGK